MTFAKELPSGWESVKLGKLVDISSGFSFKSKLFKHEGFPIIRIGNINNGYISDKNLVYFDPDDYKKDLSKFIINPGDIIIAMSGATVGKIAFNNSSKTYFQNQRISNIKPKINSNISKRFLYYFLSLESKKFLSFSVGSAQPNLNNEYISKLIIKLPPLEVQEKIVEILDKAERLKELREESTKKSEELRKSILQKQVTSHFYEKKLPHGWKLVNLEELCSKITDGSHHSPKITVNGYPYITVKDISEMREVDLKNSKRISKKDFIELKNSGCMPKHGDILFSKDGTVGKTSLINKDEEYVVLSSIAIITPNQSKVLNEYLFEYLSSNFFIRQAIENKTGAAIKRIVLKKLKKIKVIVPPIDEQQKIILKMNISKKYQKISLTSNYQTQQLTSSLLQKAFNGEFK